jgi:hypothetical protein
MEGGEEQNLDGRRNEPRKIPNGKLRTMARQIVRNRTDSCFRRLITGKFSGISLRNVWPP